MLILPTDVIELGDVEEELHLNVLALAAFVERGSAVFRIVIKEQPARVILVYILLPRLCLYHFLVSSHLFYKIILLDLVEGMRLARIEFVIFSPPLRLVGIY